MADQPTDVSVPEGFTRMEAYGPFIVLCGPLYEARRGGRVVVGMRIEDKHANKGAMIHGGMIFTLLDTAMTHAGVQVRPDDTFLLTSSFSSDLLASGRIGDWIEAEIEVLRAGRRVIFFQGIVRRDGPEGEILARGSATFQVVAKP